MKIFRIVADSFSGYEAQVKYSWFPLVWLQLNEKFGVNTFFTKEEAMEFIEKKRNGSFASKEVANGKYWENADLEMKRLFRFRHFFAAKKVICTERKALQTGFEFADNTPVIGLESAF